MQQPDGALQLAFHRPRFVDGLLELGSCQRAAFIKQLIANGTATRQAILGQQKACTGHLVLGHIDCGAIGTGLVGNMGLAQIFHHLGGFIQIKVAIEQRHGLGAAPEDKKPQHTKQHSTRRAEGDQSCTPKVFQASQYILHIPGTATLSQR